MALLLSIIMGYQSMLKVEQPVPLSMVLVPKEFLGTIPLDFSICCHFQKKLLLAGLQQTIPVFIQILRMGSMYPIISKLVIPINSKAERLLKRLL